MGARASLEIEAEAGSVTREWRKPHSFHPQLEQAIFRIYSGVEVNFHFCWRAMAQVGPAQAPPVYNGMPQRCCLTTLARFGWSNLGLNNYF
jgi:hypothetical protein